VCVTEREERAYIAVAFSKVNQCAFPVTYVNAAGTSKQFAPLRISAAYSSGNRTS